MKINRGKGITTAQCLAISNGNMKDGLVLVDGFSLIKVTTDNTDFDEVIEGYFEFVDDEHIYVGGVGVPIEYIEEIELLD